MDNKTFKCREDIPLKDRWATEDLYASDELWEQELERMVQMGKVMAGYAGTLGRDAATLFDYMQKLEEIQVLSAQLANYAQRKGDVDTRVAAYQAMCSKFSAAFVARAPPPALKPRRSWPSPMKPWRPFMPRSPVWSVTAAISPMSAV